MIFGKHINRYYLKYSPLIILGILALFLVDNMHLLIPNLYGMVINGIENGTVEIDGVIHNFDINFLLDKICLPMLFVIASVITYRKGRSNLTSIGSFVGRIAKSPTDTYVTAAASAPFSSIFK